MKNAIGAVLIGLLLSLSSISFALQIQEDNLTDIQKHQIEELAAKLKQEAARAKANGTDIASVSTAKKVDEWVGVTEHLGKALAGTAKELGIAANDFLQTPAGLLTAGVIVFKMFGGLIVHAAGGIVILMIGGALFVTILRRSGDITYTYALDKQTWWGGKVLLKKEQKKMNDDDACVLIVTAIVTTSLFLIVVFSY